ncbi:MAG: hypothetical protein EBZ91_08895 [Gammaproteobacteria bacterium]|nr:hypothetical protein [Gammaproteobacteria bacterium]
MKTPDPLLIEILSNEEAYRLGIIPLSNSSLGSSLAGAFEEMPPEQARVMKRKFRKLWRKLARAASRGGAEMLIRGSNEAQRLGLGDPKPARHNNFTRKTSVFWELRRRARKRAAGD